MYQSEYPASSINILSSETLEPNVVSKSPTMAELIPIYNAFFTASTLICERPPAKRIEGFLRILQKNKINATIRKEMGKDINAACGQLRAKFNDNK